MILQRCLITYLTSRDSTFTHNSAESHQLDTPKANWRDWCEDDGKQNAARDCCALDGSANSDV